MKLKTLIWSSLLLLAATEAFAADAGLRYIGSRGLIRCGTDLSTRSYAYKDEEKVWTPTCAGFSQWRFSATAAVLK